MSRYERVNLMAQYRATPLGGTAQVSEWEVRFFEPGQAANSAFYTSRRDADRDIDRHTQRGFGHEGPFPARARPSIRTTHPSPDPDSAAPAAR